VIISFRSKAFRLRSDEVALRTSFARFLLYLLSSDVELADLDAVSSDNLSSQA